MKRALFTLGFLGLTVPSLAGNARAEERCFDIVHGPGQAVPQYILIDRCKGRTWALLPAPVLDAKGQPVSPPSYSLRWSPIGTQTSEGTIKSPSP